MNPRTWTLEFIKGNGRNNIGIESGPLPHPLPHRMGQLSPQGDDLNPIPFIIQAWLSVGPSLDPSYGTDQHGLAVPSPHVQMGSSGPTLLADGQGPGQIPTNG